MVMIVRQREESEPHGSHLILTLEQTNNVWKCNFILEISKRFGHGSVKSWSITKSFGIPKMRLDFLNIKLFFFHFQIGFSAIYFLLDFTLLLCLQGLVASLCVGAVLLNYSGWEAPIPICWTSFWYSQYSTYYLAWQSDNRAEYFGGEIIRKYRHVMKKLLLQLYIKVINVGSDTFGNPILQKVFKKLAVTLDYKRPGMLCQ